MCSSAAADYVWWLKLLDIGYDHHYCNSGHDGYSYDHHYNSFSSCDNDDEF